MWEIPASLVSKTCFEVGNCEKGLGLEKLVHNRLIEVGIFVLPRASTSEDLCGEMVLLISFSGEPYELLLSIKFQELDKPISPRASPNMMAERAWSCLGLVGASAKNQMGNHLGLRREIPNLRCPLAK